MTAPGREFIENEFGVRVFSLYNAVEAFKIGFTCEASRGYHIHEDLCHLKIVGPDGVHVPDGTTGEIVISNLVNRGTVLLNYRLGDMGAMATEPCACGCPLPLLEHLCGRVGEVLVLENDSLIHPSSVWGVMRAVPEALRYQLIQIEPERFEIKVLTADRMTFSRIAPDLETRLKGLLGHATVDPVFAPELANLVPHKFRPVISRCSARMDSAPRNGKGSR
jgi:phenylacetate-CoA ligase